MTVCLLLHNALENGTDSNAALRWGWVWNDEIQIASAGMLCGGLCDDSFALSQDLGLSVGKRLRKCEIVVK